MTFKIACTQSSKNVRTFTQPEMKHKNLETPENRTLPNFKPPKMGEACLPTYLTFDMCPRVLWPSRVYISTLVGFIFDFRGPLCQSQRYKPVFGLLAPHSKSALFSRSSPGLHVQGSLKKPFWTLLGSLKASGSLEVLGLLKVPHRPFFFLAKVALIHWNMQMVKCDHQILLERKMTDFYVRGTSFRILFIDFLTLILHNLPEAVIKAPCFSWYLSIGLVY